MTRKKFIINITLSAICGLLVNKNFGFISSVSPKGHLIFRYKRNDGTNETILIRRGDYS